jgi:hypothetical protein
LHKAAVPGDISSEDHCKPSHQSLARGRTILAAAYGTNCTARSVSVVHRSISKTTAAEKRENRRGFLSLRQEKRATATVCEDGLDDESRIIRQDDHGL